MHGNCNGSPLQRTDPLSHFHRYLLGTTRVSNPRPRLRDQDDRGNWHSR